MDNVNNTMDRIISDEEKRRKNTRRAIKVGVAIALAGAGIYGVSQFMRTSVSLDNLIVN